MKLNCEQGDIAIIVKSGCGNEGKIVRCLEYMGVMRFIPDTNGNQWRHRDGPQHMWRIDRTINFGNSLDVVQIGYCNDSVLRPLRGDLTQDDTTTTEELNTVV